MTNLSLRNAGRTPEVKLRFLFPTLLVCFSTLCLSLTQVSVAQVQISQSGRKVIQSTKPDYPKSLKDAHIGGLVRLNATVLPNGSVIKVQILGGNPVFAESATKAVMKWKFLPASSQTNEEIQLHFNPN